MVTGSREIFPGILDLRPQLDRGVAASCATNPIEAMKNDYSFKLVAAIVLAGVLVAIVSPSPTAHNVDAAAAETSHSATHTE